MSHPVVSFLLIVLLLVPSMAFSQQAIFVDRWDPRSYIVSTANFRISASSPQAVCDKIVAQLQAQVVFPNTGINYVGTLVRRNSSGSSWWWACEVRERGFTMISSYSEIQPWCHDAAEYNYPPFIHGYRPKIFNRFATKDECSCGAVVSPFFVDAALVDPSKDQCQLFGAGSCTQWAKSSCFVKVSELQASMPPPDSAKSVFHKTQLCIAGQSCLDTCRNDNCKWMGKVIEDFVDPYLKKTGLWSAIENGCSFRNSTYPKAIADRFCALDMATYHIKFDLDQALIEHGCGSEDDWKRVYLRIQECSFNTGFPAVEQQLSRS